MGDLAKTPDDYLGEMINDFMDLTVRAPAFGTRVWSPAVDVKATDKEYVLEADLPGMTEKDVDVRVEADRLTVSSTREEEHEEEDDGYLRRERFTRSFRRSFRLPSDVEKSKIDAHFRNGVLTIDMPRSDKARESKGRTIKVKAGSK